jgi:hypothetical protein
MSDVLCYSCTTVMLKVSVSPVVQEQARDSKERITVIHIVAQEDAVDGLTSRHASQVAAFAPTDLPNPHI